MAKIAAEGEPARRRRSFSQTPVFAGSLAVVFFSISLLAYLSAPGTGDTATIRPRSLPAVYAVTEKPFTPETAPAGPSEPAADKPKAQYAVMSRADEGPEPRKPRPARAKPTRPPEPAFYPIGIAEKAEDAAIDGRVVRVEMPRSALFALGVDVPLENGTRAVTADLLLGADGTPKAIRLVE